MNRRQMQAIPRRMALILALIATVFGTALPTGLALYPAGAAPFPRIQHGAIPSAHHSGPRAPTIPVKSVTGPRRQGLVSAFHAGAPPRVAAPRAMIRPHVFVTGDAVTEYQPNLPAGWGGRAVAADVSPLDTNVGIVASETGGLFKTVDGGANWSHLDGLPAFLMSDVKYAPSDDQIVVATAAADDRAADGGGIWLSTDGGDTWQNVAPPAPAGCSTRYNAWGISFAPGTGDVFVGTDCGVALSRSLGQSGTWTLLSVEPGVVNLPTWAVVAQPPGGGTIDDIVDVCTANGHFHSEDAGVTWASDTGSQAPVCFGGAMHGIAASPFEPGVLFVAARSFNLSESDNGAGWTNLVDHDLAASRQPWVATQVSLDGVPGDFEVYFGSGNWVFRQTCHTPADTTSTVPRCQSGGCTQGVSQPLCDNFPSAARPWFMLFTPHADTNAIAFSTVSPPGACPEFLLSDGGISTTADCGLHWSMAGGGSGGYDALQIYDLAGQVHPDHTDLYFGTQDNELWASPDNGATWENPIQWEGANLQITHDSPSDAGQTITYQNLSDSQNYQAGAHFDPNSITNWTNPPGPPVGSPVVVSTGVYVQWGQVGAQTWDLYLSTTGGQDWSDTGASISQPPWAQPLVAGPPDDPTIYQAVAKPGFNRVGLIQITGLAPMIAGTGSRTGVVNAADGGGDPTFGLSNVGAYCEGPGPCPAVFGVDPNDPLHLIAADSIASGPGLNVMKYSTNGGRSWTVDTQLTNLVTGNGQFLFDAPNRGTSVHFIRWDPTNEARIIVGTEAAGIIASQDGGQSWRVLPGSQKVTYATAAFFDATQNDVIVSTFGRGLWRLNFPTLQPYTPFVVSPSNGSFNDNYQFDTGCGSSDVCGFDYWNAVGIRSGFDGTGIDDDISLFTDPGYTNRLALSNENPPNNDYVLENDNGFAGLSPSGPYFPQVARQIFFGGPYTIEWAAGHQILNTTLTDSMGPSSGGGPSTSSASTTPLCSPARPITWACVPRRATVPT